MTTLPFIPKPSHPHHLARAPTTVSKGAHLALEVCKDESGAHLHQGVTPKHRSQKKSVRLESPAEACKGPRKAAIQSRVL